MLGLLAATALALSGCDETSRLPAEAGYGPQPSLPAPAPQRPVVSSRLGTCMPIFL